MFSEFFFKDATFGNKGFQRFSEGRNLCVERWFVNGGSPRSILNVCTVSTAHKALHVGVNTNGGYTWVITESNGAKI